MRNRLLSSVTVLKQRLKISLIVPMKKLCFPHSVLELNSSPGLKEKNGQGKKNEVIRS